MLKQFEKLFAVAMLLYCTLGLLPAITGDPSDSAHADGNPLALAVQTAFYLVAFCLISIHWRTVVRGAWKAKWILLLVFVAVVSTVWSQSPLFTFRRSAVMLATTVFGIYFGSRFTVPEQLRLLGWTCALIVFSTYFIAILLPHYGVEHLDSPGAWRGAFLQKNALARAMVLSMFVFYFARPPAGRWLRWVGIAAALCLLVLSKSATGIVVLSVMVAILPLYRLLRTKFTFAIPVFIVLGVVAVGSGFLFYMILPALLGMLHKDLTLTGRTEVWHALLLPVANHPWLGYGFDTFWTAAGESATVAQEVSWGVAGGHNGLLDVALDLGILGLSVFVAGYVVICRRALRLVRKATGTVPLWLCTYLVFALLYSLSESTVFRLSSIFWILYTSTAVCVSLYVPPSAPPVIDLAQLRET